MKVLITGGSGYLGGRISEFLADLNYDVSILVRKVPPQSEQWLQKFSDVLLGDIKSIDIQKSIIEKQFDAILYTISLDHHQSEKDISNTISTNVTPLWNLLDLISKTSYNSLKKFIYFSTQQVYGKLSTQLVNENSNLNPVNNYGLTHLMGEQICQLYSKKLKNKFINLRISNGYGYPIFNSCNCWTLVINDFCKTAIEKKEIKLLSDGSPVRDFISISNICRIIQYLLEIPNEKIEYNCYNIGSGNSLTILELAHIVADRYNILFNEKIPVILPNKFFSQSSSSHQKIEKFKYDTSRITETGFELNDKMNDELDKLFQFIIGQNNG